MDLKNISISIDVAAEEVYRFAYNPLNLPKWAAGLSDKPVRKDAEGWIVETPEGPAKFRFVPRNTLGVLDHYLTLPSGVEVYSPMRVIANGKGSELVFTLLHAEGMSDEQFAKDQELIAADFKTLKRLLESGVREPADAPPSPAPPAPVKAVNRNLFVGGLPFDLTQDGLAKAFASCGKIAKVKILTDPVKRQSKGLGFVEFATDDGARAALAKMNGAMLGGRKIFVVEARPKEQLPPPKPWEQRERKGPAPWKGRELRSMDEGKRPWKKFDKKPFDRTQGKPFEKKSFGKPFERKPFGKPFEKKPFDKPFKKSFDKPFRKPFRKSEGGPEGRPAAPSGPFAKFIKKKPFRSGQDKPFKKPEH